MSHFRAIFVLNAITHTNSLMTLQILDNVDMQQFPAVNFFEGMKYFYLSPHEIFGFNMSYEVQTWFLISDNHMNPEGELARDEISDDETMEMYVFYLYSQAAAA